MHSHVVMNTMKIFYASTTGRVGGAGGIMFSYSLSVLASVRLSGVLFRFYNIYSGRHCRIFTKLSSILCLRTEVKCLGFGSKGQSLSTQHDHMC